MKVIALKKQTLVLLLILFLVVAATKAEVVVKTFLDVNNNGIQDTTEILIGGLTVTGFDELGNVYPFLTAGDGVYSLPIVPERLRVEVSGYGDFLMQGVAGSTSVFFVEDGDQILVAVSNGPTFDYENSLVMIPCYDGGPAFANDAPAFVSFPFTVNGTAMMFGGNAPNPHIDAYVNEIGSTWGVAYHRDQQKAVTSALAKRHVGIGPESWAGFYILDYSDTDSNGKPALTGINIEGLVPKHGPAIHMGNILREKVTGDVTGDQPYALTTKPNTATYDMDAFAKIGKVAFGDIDFTEDEEDLWMVNLNQRSLIKIEVGDDFESVSGDMVSHYPIDEMTNLPNLNFRYMMCINTGSNSNVQGAETFTDKRGTAWDKNKYFTGGIGSYKSFNASNTYDDPTSTSDALLYKTYRRGNNFSYNFPIPAEEEYTVIFHFAEPENINAGDRVFDVSVEGNVVLNDYDIIFAAGDKRRAHTETIVVQATGPTLDIDFSSVQGQAVINGIEIRGTSVMNSGVLRPWGLKFNNGKGYLGLVADASISQSREHLFGYVMSFDPDNMGSLTEEVAFSLAYPRERASNAHIINTPQALRSGEWQAWASTWAETMIPTQGEQLSTTNALLCSYPQPIISDIEFTNDGSMIIGMMDRWGHQCGYRNYAAIPFDQTYVVSYGVGDVLKAFKEHPNSRGAGDYTLEKTNNDPGVYDGSTFYRGSEDGPSFDGEFFYEDHFVAASAHHGEVFTGGMALMRGSNELVGAVFNPLNPITPEADQNFVFDGIYSQGVHFYNVDDGKKVRAYLFVDQFVSGKANGTGDTEQRARQLGGEVGNYIWCDANGNGIQDGTEFGIEGISVTLHDKDNAFAMVDSTATDANGEYYFRNVEVGECYQIRINTAQLIAMGFTGAVTAIDQGANDAIDSDFNTDSLPGYATLCFCYPDIINDHSFDAGFVGPAANDVTVNLCEDLMNCSMGEGNITLSDLDPLVDPSGINNVNYYPTFNEADSMLNQIVVPSICVTDGEMIFARVNVQMDTMCFAIAKITFNVSPDTTPTSFVYYNFTVCEGAALDLSALLATVSLTNGNAVFYDDCTLPAGAPVMGSGQIGTPTMYVPASFPDTICFIEQIVDGCSANFGRMVFNPYDTASVEAGNPSETCGLECVDLTTLGASFNPNGNGAIMAEWTTSGNGTFVEDNTYAGASMYCPDSTDMYNGGVTLYLSVLDDPCIAAGMIIDSVFITIFNPGPRVDSSTLTIDTISCLDSFAINPEMYDTFPPAILIVNCTDSLESEIVDYRVIPLDCPDGIVKIIVRTHKWTYNKQMFFATDTISIAALDFSLFTCPPMMDTLYCNDTFIYNQWGYPIPTYSGVPTIDSIPLWPMPPELCDIIIYYEDVHFTGKCPETFRRDWWIKNLCTGEDTTCSQWIMIFDTLPPTADICINEFEKYDGDTILVPSTTHDCSAYTYVPRVKAEDICSGIKVVKARIEGIATLAFTYNAEDDKWESHEQVQIYHDETPTKVVYEIFDSCHLYTKDSIYIKVKDKTPPVTVCDKGITVAVTDTAVWVYANSINEGSFDNCAIEFLLARRTDWMTACGIDLCDYDTLHSVYNGHDSIWCAVLEEDKHINPIEAYYAQQIDWLLNDESECGQLLGYAWLYELCKKATLDCHDSYLNKDQFKQAFLLSHFGEGYSSLEAKNIVDQIDAIGGGWAEKVAFCCTDACTEVKVELLAMDYWCNWSKCWTNVRVEDKTPPKVVSDLQDISITCASYKTYYQEAVQKAIDGDFADIQEKLGTYQQVAIDVHGNYGTPDEFTIKYLECDDDVETVQKYLYNEHTGEFYWYEDDVVTFDYDTLERTYFNGRVADNCGLQVIESEPWIDIDHCGYGVIYRKFMMVGICDFSEFGDHKIDTIIRHQKIWITEDCPMTETMFSYPNDVEVFDCGITYDDDGNVIGTADPSVTGKPEYLYDNDCRLVGIGHYDQVFKVVGGDQACYKVIRNWVFADWCGYGGEPAEKEWWKYPQYEGAYFTYQQKIIIRDTTPPMCMILDLPDEIETSGCAYNLSLNVSAEDACGLLNYLYQIKELGKEVNTVVASGSGSLNTKDAYEFNISEDSLAVGSYLLKVIIRDECQNETVCEKEFEILAGKKPTPVCLSSITVELTPVDTNNDGTIDEATAVVWADEYNVSSSPVCGNSANKLDFRIDDATGDPELPPSSADHLDLNCEDSGTKLVRMYVVDESGTWDYCDVILVVQNNMGGCDSTQVASAAIVSGTIVTEDGQPIEQVEMYAMRTTGDIIDQMNQAPGTYNLEVIKGLNTLLKPVKDINDLNGVSTVDLVRIQMHILGRKQLENEYREIAADANADGTISPVDLVVFRRLIMGQFTDIPDNTSWRFFEKYTKQEILSIPSMPDKLIIDWIGVKIGDVTLDNDPRRIARSNKSMVFSIPNATLQSGEVVLIPVTVISEEAITGFQYTLQASDELELLDVISENKTLINKNNFALNRLEEGILTSSWNHPNAVASNLNEEGILFYVLAKAKSIVELSDVLTINGLITASEAYDAEYRLMNVSLEFNQNQGLQHTLMQNTPNPFGQSTQIPFYLDVEAEAYLSIYDINGKILWQQKGTFLKGLNQVTVQAKELNQSGILYYKLETEEFSAVRKMIMIR